MIELKDLSRTFYLGETPVHALAGVSETISTGEHVAIMGPSGSGKSTLLHILGCLDRPTAGEYWLDGQAVAQLSDAELTRIRRHKIGFVFQFFHLIGRLTAAENVELPMIFAGVQADERRRRVLEALRRVGLEHRMRHRPEELSGGERQRVALARAIIMQPSVILADEPTGNLDTASGNVVLDLLDDLNEGGMTVVVVTHDPKVAHRADRIVVLVDGRVSLRVPSSEIGRVLELMASEETPGSDDEAST